MSGWPMSLELYRAATALAEPAASWLLSRRAARGKEDPVRIGERLGRASVSRPQGPLVWIHAVSIGESLSHLPLVERLVEARPELNLLVTSSTRTSGELLAQRLPKGVIHQYAPIDAPGAVRRFLNHWRPDLAVFIESELWPNLLKGARDGGAKLALLGARISTGSAAGWSRAPAAAEAVLNLFDVIYAQDLETRAFIEEHGVHVSGQLDLKRLAEPLPVDGAALMELEAAVRNRDVVLAASTHEGEEALIAKAVRSIEPKPLLVVVPRHPERGGDVAASLTGLGWRVARRSRGEAIEADVDAYVADTLGELGVFYALADVAVLGGSFVEGLTGHNPLEPARLRAPVITGVHHEAFAETYADLLDHKAVLIVRDERELKAAVASLLADRRLAATLAERGRSVAEAGREAFEPAWTRLQTLLPP